MHKYILILLFAPIFLACNGSNKSHGDSDQKKVFTVTIETQRYFLDQITGGNFTINTLVPPGTSPETYEPAPSVIMNMSKSELYFKVGDLGFEKAWSARLAQNNPNMAIIDCSEGIELIENEDHHHSGSHAGHNHGAMDPHVWSSPLAVKIFTQNMLEGVVSIDPENEDFYRSNFEEFLGKVDSVDQVISNILVDSPTRSFIIYHPALGYFAHDYDLHQHSIEFEGKSPSPAQMRGLIDIARDENISTVFIQKGFDAKNAEVVAREIGADVFEIDPLSYNWDEELIRIASLIAREK